MRVLLYFLVLIGVQGGLARLLPTAVPAPDLFLLTGVVLALRWPPIWAVLGAYAVGLLQDLLGHGSLGLHAAGVAGGALLVLGLRKFLGSEGALQLLVMVVAAVAGQWITYLIISYWLRNSLVTIPTLTGVLPITLLGTLILAVPVAWAARWAFGARPNARQVLP